MNTDDSLSRAGRRKRRRWRLGLVPVLVALTFLAGMATVLYPTASAWINQAQQSQIIGNLNDEVSVLPVEGRAESIAAAHDYNAKISSGAVVAANTNVPTAEAPDLAYASLLTANGSGLMARIKIPSVAVDLPIYHGTSDAVLLRGVGHLEGTSLPVGGESTHSVLTGHRGLATAEMFTNLDRVDVGDRFTIEVFGEVLTYEVRSTQVVDPAATEILRPVKGEDLVTLVTCTPLGINTQRILVTGERITPTPVADLESAGRVPDIPGFPWWAVVLGAGVVASGVYVWLSGRPRRQRARRASEPEPAEDGLTVAELDEVLREDSRVR